MEGVKTNTTPIGVENRVGNQMVQIDNDTCQKNQNNPKPVFLKEQKTDSYRNQKVDAVMDKKPKHVKSLNPDVVDSSKRWYLH